MEKSTWRLFVTVNGPRCVDASWPPSLTRYLPVIQWRYASRRHREVALCHGALFRFVCSLASINHVLSHPLFRVPTPLLFPSSSSSSHFSTPSSLPSHLFTVSRARCTGNGFIRRGDRWENRAEVRRCVEDEFGEDVIFCLRFSCVIFRGGGVNVVSKIEMLVIWIDRLWKMEIWKKEREMMTLIIRWYCTMQ